MKKRSRNYSTSVVHKTQVDFEPSIAVLEVLFLNGNIILVDRKLKKYIGGLSSPKNKALVYYLDGSEETKSIQTLTALLDRIFISKKFLVNKKTKIVVIGGGTLGDFGGFLAHILKRGLELILVPSTWLSAMDSAHGGKNGINYKEIKNQLGTIFPATKVIIIKSLLEQQPLDRTIEGYGELIKIAYIDSGSFFKKIAKEKLNKIDIFKYLPLAIDAKYKIVKQDPYETRGIRYILNFGHTIAHVWESRLGIHHGIAVILGMYFDFLWADKKGYNVGKDLKIFFQSEVVYGVLNLFYTDALFSVSSGEIKSSLLADKKRENEYIKYVFPRGHSKLKIEPVSVLDIYEEFLRQKQLIENRRDV